MKAVHEFIVIARCPVNDQVDVYRATLTLDRQVDVETILDTAAEYRGQSVYQEDLTQQLAYEFGGTVVTVGNHSGVTTTVTAEP